MGGRMRQTALHAEHVRLGAKLVDFSGYEMPLAYEGILVEHRAVRERVGLFDVSHMGEFRVSGPGGAAFVDAMLTNRISSLAPGGALYTPMCNEEGGTVDDLIVYRHAPDDFLMVVNAANIAKDFAWLEARCPTGVTLEDVSDETGLVAVQGPGAAELLDRVGAHQAPLIARYNFASDTVCGSQATVARLGYTGEDGFEVMVAAQDAPVVWRGLLEAGESLGARPAGLGARDTLRFEVCYCLYGHELTESVSPLEAGIGWTVKLKGRDFIGAQALRRQKSTGIPRRLVGLTMLGRRVPRQGAAVKRDGQVLGQVTSGMFAPSLDKPAALALVREPAVKVGDTVQIDLRGRQYDAKVVDTPFYRRPD